MEGRIVAKMSGHNKKLIEVSLPLEAINRESVREKSISSGHPSTLHLWWARRPLAACRAILFSQLVDDPSSNPLKFPTLESQKIERARLFSIIEELVKWENSSNESVLDAAKTEILKSSYGREIDLLDPFSGGGSIPLEAKRLGLKAIANDLNPLPILINTVIQKIVGRFEGKVSSENNLNGNSAVTMSEDLKKWSEVLQSRVYQKVGHLYGDSSKSAIPLVYFWARTVTCPNPACGIATPLVGSWAANDRRGHESYFKPIRSVDGKSVDVEVVAGKAPKELATMIRAGGTCPLCKTGFKLDYVKAEAQAGRMSSRLLGVQQVENKLRTFRPASQADRNQAEVEKVYLEWLDLPLSKHPQYMAPPRFGLNKFSDLFLDRQLITLKTFVEELEKLEPEISLSYRDKFVVSDTKNLTEGGAGAFAYAQSIKLLLAMSISRLTNRCSTLCIWDSGATKISQVFVRQAYSMTWFFAEANPFGGGSGSYEGQVDYLVKALARLPLGHGIVMNKPAQELDIPKNVVVSTDPPYYDSVPYADLSDYFVVWLRKMLATSMPEIFTTVLSPKASELVADHVRHNDKASAGKFFEDGLTDVFARIHASHSDEYPMTVFYAFKAKDDEGNIDIPTGWETFLSSLLTAGWKISGTWPVRTEQPGGLRELGRNALASSVVVVCRKRDELAQSISRRAFITEMKKVLPTSLREMQQGSIAPVDLAQAAIGPGMEIFSKYSEISEADGTAMSIRTALALINQTLGEVLNEQESDFDSETLFCVKWFAQYQWDEGPFGQADTLARAVNVSINTMMRNGVFTSSSSKAKLKNPKEMDLDWNPSLDKDLSVWEVTVKLSHIIGSKGIEKAREVLQQTSEAIDIDAVKELAYLIYNICEKRGWSETGVAFNALVTSWIDMGNLIQNSNLPAQSQETFDFTLPIEE
jgi:putative DNA methylase